MDIVSKQSDLNAYLQSGTQLNINPATVKGEDLLQQPLAATDAVRLSEESFMYQKLDDLYDQVDSIYLSHVSAADKKMLEKAYAELDALYQSDKSSDVQNQRADALFVQIDNIFNAASAHLSEDERQRIDQLNEKIDVLFEQYEDETFAELPDDVYAALEPLEKELDGILNSKLSAQQKDKLNELHQKIGRLFDQSAHSEDDEQAIEAAFDKIDGIMNKSFAALSKEDKGRVEALENQIERLYDSLSGATEQLGGYYPV